MPWFAHESGFYAGFCFFLIWTPTATGEEALVYVVPETQDSNSYLGVYPPLPTLPTAVVGEQNLSLPDANPQPQIRLSGIFPQETGAPHSSGPGGRLVKDDR